MFQLLRGLRQEDLCESLSQNKIKKSWGCSSVMESWLAYKMPWVQASHPLAIILYIAPIWIISGMNTGSV